MATYYIKPNGDDSRNGLSVDTAWKKWSVALPKLVNGDKLKALGGTWLGGDVGYTTLSGRSNITIEPYDSSSFPILDLQKMPVDNWDSAPIKFLNCSGIVLDGVTIKNSKGRGIFFSNCKSSTIKNCTTDWTYRQGISMTDANDTSAKYYLNNKSYKAIMSYGTKRDGAGLQIRNCRNVTVSNCVCGDSEYDGLMCSRNYNCTYTGNFIYDSYMGNLYVEGSQDITMDRNLSVQTKGEGMTFGIRQEGAGDIPVKNVTVRNNIFYGPKAYRNVIITPGVKHSTTGIDNVKIANNFIYGGSFSTIRVDTANLDKQTQSYFINNIIIKGGGKIAESASQDVAFARFHLYNNAWSDAGYTTFSKGLKTGNLGPGSWNVNTHIVDYDYAFGSAANFDATKMKLQTGTNPLVDAGTNSYVSNTEDYWGYTRPYNSTNDIGAHERDAGGTPVGLTAGLTVNGSAPPQLVAGASTVSLADNSTATGGASITHVLWRIWNVQQAGDPVYETNELAPTWVVPSTNADYKVEYTIFDADNGVQSTILVNPAFSCYIDTIENEPPVSNKLITFSTSNTYVAHGMGFVPDAAIVVMSNATTDETPADHAQLSVGFYANGNNKAASIVSYSQAGQASKYNVRKHNTAKTIALHNPDLYGSMTFDATNVNLDWVGGTGGQKGWALLFGGMGINATVHQMEFTGPGQKMLAISPNLVFAITTGKPAGLADGYQGAMWSIGAAASNDEQACVMVFEPRNNPTKAIVRSGAIGYATDDAKFNAIFDPGQFIVNYAGAGEATLSILALNINDAYDKSVTVINTPPNSAALDYSLDHSPGTLIALLSNMVESEIYTQSDSAGFIGLAAADGSATQSTVVYMDPSPAGETVTGSVTDNAWIQYSEAGVQTQKTSVALGASKYTLDQDNTTYDSSRKAVVITLESTSTSTDPVAAFGWTWPDPNRTVILVGDNVQFADMSTASTGRTIVSWLWSFDDFEGGAPDTSTYQNASYTFATDGPWGVSLEVTDSSAATGSFTRNMMVWYDKPEGENWTVTPDPPTGASPLELEFDASGVTAEAGYTIKIFEWACFQSDVPEGTAPIAVRAYGTTASLTLTEPGWYDMWFIIHADKDGQPSDNDGYPLYSTLYKYEDLIWVGVYTPEDLVIQSDTNIGGAYVGPQAVNFSAQLDGHTASTSLVASATWAFGDGNTSTYFAPTHTYAAVSSVATYNVSLSMVLDDTDSTLLTDEITSFIYIVPAADDPRNSSVDELYTELERLQPFLGIIDSLDWVQQAAPNASVWKADLDAPWADGMTWVVTEAGITNTVASAISGASQLVVSDSSMYTAGDTIQVELDNGTYEEHTIDSIDGSRITVDDTFSRAVPSGATISKIATLTTRASIALCQANPGSAYVTFADPTLSVYVHTTTGDSPVSNGFCYRWSNSAIT